MIPVHVLALDVQYHPDMQSEHLSPEYPEAPSQVHSPEVLQSEDAALVPVVLQLQSEVGINMSVSLLLL